MDALFSRLALADVHRDVARNIVSLRTSQDLFDDLSSAPEDWRLAQQVEDAVKPPPYTSAEPAIHREPRRLVAPLGLEPRRPHSSARGISSHFRPGVRSTTTRSLSSRYVR